MEEERLKAAIRDICNGEWDAREKPVFLSRLPRILADQFQIDYRLILGGKSLKAFVGDVSPDDGYKLVQHPTQRAKVCIVPSHVDFSFQVGSQDVGTKGLSEQDRQGFLNVLRALSPDELSQLQIPASVLIRLFDNA